MPQIEWKEENRRYALCFLPLIGAVIGGLILLWRYICVKLGIGSLLFGAVSAVIPIIITGGIHLDGFCDVSDAKASCASKERALEIMSDSHIGAFASISLGVYLLLDTAFFSEINNFRALIIAAFSFVISRALSSLAAVTFRCAKKEGALQSFARPAHKNATIAALTVILMLGFAAMIYIYPAAGAAGAVGAAGTFLYYKRFSYKRFDGITGDLAGYFLQICELSSLVCIVMTDKIIAQI